MIKVFIADADAAARNWLCSTIQWEKFGMELIGQASDGETALPLVYKNQPDLIIADANLPYLDGLALCRLAKRENPHLKIAILCKNDSYDCARRAVELGAQGLLSYPCSADELNRAIEAATDSIKQDTALERERAELCRDTEQYSRFVRRQFFEQMAEGSISIEEIYEKAAQLGISLQAQSYNTALIVLRSEAITPEYAEQNKAIKAEMKKSFEKHSEYQLFDWDMASYAVLIKSDGDELSETTEQCIKIVRRIFDAAQLPANWTLAIGHPVHRISELPRSFAAVRELMSIHGTMPDKHILTEQTASGKADANPIKSLENIDPQTAEPMQISAFLQTGLRSDISSFVDTILNQLGEAAHNTAMQHYLLLAIRFSAQMMAKQLGRDLPMLPLPEKINAAALREAAIAEIEAILAVRDEESQSQKHSITKNAIRYINQNYADEQISLNSTAKAVNVSANYLSTIFTKETGISFVEYLTEVRMTQAKKLLRQTGKRSGEIAFEIGYKDPRYFSYIFKKTQGCTPREYKAAAETEKMIGEES